MKTLTKTITIAALCGAVAACGQDADPAQADDAVSASDAVRAFAGAWRPTAGTVTTKCAGGEAVSERVLVNLTWATRGDDADLVTNDLGSCAFHANVTGSTASAAPNQGCVVSDGAYGFTTTAFTSYTFTVSPDGQTATEDRAGTIDYEEGVTSSPACSFVGTATYERAPS
jgi:hypothetical protein